MRKKIFSGILCMSILSMALSVSSLAASTDVGNNRVGVTCTRTRSTHSVTSLGGLSTYPFGKGYVWYIHLGTYYSRKNVSGGSSGATYWSVNFNVPSGGTISKASTEAYGEEVVQYP